MSSSLLQSLGDALSSRKSTCTALLLFWGILIHCTARIRSSHSSARSRKPNRPGAVVRAVSPFTGRSDFVLLRWDRRFALFFVLSSMLVGRPLGGTVGSGMPLGEAWSQ